MKCRWYADFEGVCTNGECPYRGDTCPTSEYPEVCRYADATQEPELNAEELAAEKNAKKPDRISVKDKPPEKKHEAYLCSLDSCLLSGGQYIDDIRVFYDDGKCGERPGHSLDAAAGATEGGNP
jgi:hypothetical protein|uniref:Uncharacterized protein n=1 Tax=Siphoviridae sp. ct4Am4 TaxID=2826287 RepID=A0A8S5R1W3_9CAUD|nr:MAG TPA: hypothetical protein [Siphoviridae sp. ct4Am4]